MNSVIFENYQVILSELKEKIRQARLRTTYYINVQLLHTYWEIGKTISEQEKEQGWGAKVVETLSKDLLAEFPDLKGLSTRNLRYMRDFAVAYPHFPFLQARLATNPSRGMDYTQEEILQAPLAKLSWYHHITLITKVKDPVIRGFYIQKTVDNGWSRDVLVHQIEAGLHKSQGRLTNNFKTVLDSENSELVHQLFKDPYKFEFVYLGNEAKERDLEDALISQITNVLLEFGQHFAFMGRQYKVNLGEKEYRYDLLFYHTRLKSYIIIDLKIGEFQPEHLGKMDFYLKLADDQLRDGKDQPSIGLILCKTKNGLVAEYALRDTSHPIGVSEYKISEALPENIKGELPSIEEIEQRMDEEINDLKRPIEKRLEKLRLRLTQRKNEEVKTAITFEIFCRLFDMNIRPLFERLIEKLNQPNSHFMSHTMHWYNGGKTVPTMVGFEQIWKEEETFKKNRNFYFSYVFHGFKMAGTDAFDTSIQLDFISDAYWYGFKLVNYNNQAEFLKKLYHQDLTKEEIEDITDIVLEQVIDNIERRISMGD